MLAASAAALALGVATSSAASGSAKVAMVVAANDQNAFQEMADGAAVAASKYGMSLTQYAPADVADDATTEVTEFQDAETTSPNGIGIMTTVPQDFGTVEQQAVAANIPVVSVDACAVPGSNVTTCVANNNEQVGEAIGEQLCKKIGKKKGEVVAGNDIPQLSLLALRVTGMEKAIKHCDPHATFTPVQNVTPDPTSNETQWASLVQQYPHALAYIAPGDQDAVSFVDIYHSTHKKYLNIACDVDPTAINGVKSGLVYGLGDPHHFLKGYIAMWMLEQNYKNGKLLTGWFNPGDGTITKKNINSIAKRETNNTTRYAYYKKTIATEIKHPSKYIKPMSVAQSEGQ
jgi:ribose transport system substrate-binding protein